MAALRIPPDSLARLAGTRFAPADLPLLCSGLHSRRLVLLTSLLTALDRRAAGLSRVARSHFEHYWRLLVAAERHRPAAVRAVLGYPSVGAWLSQALNTPGGAPFEERIGRFGAVAATAALASGISFRTGLSPYDAAVPFPGTGLLCTGEPSVRLSAGPRTVRITTSAHRPLVTALRQPGTGLHSPEPCLQTLRPLPGGRALLDDLDPCRAPREGVGDPARPAADRALVARQPWRRLWREALELLRAADPARAAEIAVLTRCVVPLAGSRPGVSAGPQASATLRAAPGAVLTTLPVSAEEFAAVLVHETQHGKLAVLADITPLHRAGPRAVYEVPWRPDPRPLDGVLQGTYAHLALADFWLHMAHRPGADGAHRESAHNRYERFRDQVSRTLPLLLECRELTAAGEEFTARMKGHHALLGRPFRGAVPAARQRATGVFTQPRYQCDVE